MPDNQHHEDTGSLEDDAGLSVRDQIEEAMRAASDSEDAASMDENTDTTDDSAAPDDDNGAAEDEDTEADQPTGEGDAEDAESSEPEQYPKSWNAEAREMFRELPSKARDYILRREREQEQGVQKLKQQYEAKSQFADQMWGAIAPYQQMIEAEGSDPARAVQNLLNMAAVMRSGSPQQKRELLLQTARQFGVDLTGTGGETGAGQSQLPEPALNSLQSEISTLKQHIIAQQQAQLQAQQQQILDEIERFKADKPYFEDVQESMGRLIEAGIADGLEDAYERAIRLDDDVWQKVQAEREKKRAKSSGDKVKKAKRAAASISGAPGAAGNNGPEPKRDLREELAAQFAAHRA